MNETIATRETKIARLLEIRKEAHAFLTAAVKAGRDFNNDEQIQAEIDKLAECNRELRELGHLPR